MKRENFTGFFLIGFLGVALVIGALAFIPALQSVRPFSWLQFLKGEPAAAFEKSFDNHLAHNDVSIDGWGNAGYRLFGEGRDGVLIGQEGWLFSTEEFALPENAAASIDANLAYIKAVHAFLADRNIALLAIPVPSKARIYENHLGSYRFPSGWKGQYRSLIKTLKDAAIPYTDLFVTFTRSKYTLPLFLKTDTHWSPDGARLAAQAVAARVDTAFPYLSFSREDFRTVPDGEAEHKGDLMKFISKSQTEIAPDRIRRFTTESGGDDLFGDKELPIVLIGTSFSANPNWNFEGFLKAALQADLLNRADEGLGPFEVMQDYLASKRFEESPPRLILWEIPERYLPVAYKLNAP